MEHRSSSIVNQRAERFATRPKFLPRHLTTRYFPSFPSFYVAPSWRCTISTRSCSLSIFATRARARAHIVDIISVFRGLFCEKRSFVARCATSNNALELIDSPERYHFCRDTHSIFDSRSNREASERRNRDRLKSLISADNPLCARHHADKVLPLFRGSLLRPNCSTKIETRR